MCNNLELHDVINVFSVIIAKRMPYNFVNAILYALLYIY